VFSPEIDSFSLQQIPLYKKVFVFQSVIFALFANMQGAALGLTCKDAWQVFSQNETLALQAKVVELEALLAHHRPPVTYDKINPQLLLRMVRNMFDDEHPPDLRAAPVTHEAWAADPLSQVNGCLWSGFADIEYSLTHYSLQTVIMDVLQNVLGDISAKYCERQSYKAIKVVRHALLGGYMASGWTLFSVQQRQEYIVWQALLDYWQEMQDDLCEFESTS